MSLHARSRRASKPAVDPAAENRARAIAAHRAGRLAIAAGAYDGLLRAAPDDHELLHLRAIIDRDAGDIPTALRRLRRAVELAPDRAPYQHDLSSVLLALGRIEEAAMAAAEAARLAPHVAECWLNLGNTHCARGDQASAMHAFGRAVDVDPNNAAARNNLGMMLLRYGNAVAAEAHFRQALAVQPRHAIAANNLGSALDAQGDKEAAAAWFQTAASIDHGYVEPLFNLSALHDQHGRWHESLALLRRAEVLAPDHIRALKNMATMLLRTGDLAGGWALYDRGYGISDFRGATRPFTVTKPGASPRRALVWGEQGIGDEILYASMIPDLIARGIECTIEVERRLVPLFRRSFTAATVVARSTPADTAISGEFDVALPLPGLGAWLRESFTCFPLRRGYLRADPALTRSLAARYRAGDAKRVIGIAWRSLARQDAAAKSIALAEWEPLLRRSDLRFVALQYGDVGRDLAEMRERFGVEIIHDPTIDQLKDMDGFAAQVAAMDAVFTTSCTTAHVAGALGVPGIVVVPVGRGLHWYWFADRTDSPWYPSLRLARQRTPERWDDAIAEAVHALASLDGDARDVAS